MSDYTWTEPQKQTAVPIAPAGYPLIIGFSFITLVFALLEIKSIALIALTATAFLCYFFRDPDRVIPKKEGMVVSPADGKVIWADIVEENPYIEGPCVKISIFMTVFNVHVNRIPHEGVVENVAYHPGKFFSANLDKASADNEKNAVTVNLPDGEKMCVVQIAGLIARRIICNVREGDDVGRGQRFGIICLGSRLDVYLPTHFRTEVTVGEKVKSGTSVLGYLS